MRPPATLQRGDVILLDVGGTLYIKRIAALPGDRIAMENGVVRLNGAAVPQRFVREETAPSAGAAKPARRLREQFPAKHRHTRFTISAPIRSTTWRSSRSRPAMSSCSATTVTGPPTARVPRIEMGVELLPIADIQGTALFYIWAPAAGRASPLTGELLESAAPLVDAGSVGQLET
jgi:signal peptidase I